MTLISDAFPNVIPLLERVSTTSGTWYAAIALTNIGDSPRVPLIFLYPMI